MVDMKGTKAAVLEEAFGMRKRKTKPKALLDRVREIACMIADGKVPSYKESSVIPAWLYYSLIVAVNGPLSPSEIARMTRSKLNIVHTNVIRAEKRGLLVRRNGIIYATRDAIALLEDIRSKCMQARNPYKLFLYKW